MNTNPLSGRRVSHGAITAMDRRTTRRRSKRVRLRLHVQSQRIITVTCNAPERVRRPSRGGFHRRLDGRVRILMTVIEEEAAQVATAVPRKMTILTPMSGYPVKKIRRSEKRVRTVGESSPLWDTTANRSNAMLSLAMKLYVRAHRQIMVRSPSCFSRRRRRTSSRDA